MSMLLVNIEAADTKSDAQIFALTRDGNYRTDPDQLLNGFFAAWPVVLLVLAGFCQSNEYISQLDSSNFFFSFSGIFHTGYSGILGLRHWTVSRPQSAALRVNHQSKLLNNFHIQ